MPINPISLPEVRFHLKLDPGEPGIARSVPPSQSTSAVAGQELGNLLGFQRKALAEGKTIIYSNITFTRGLEGNTPVLRAGRTEVVFAEKKDNLPALAPPNLEDNEGRINQEDQQNPLGIASAPEGEADLTQIAPETDGEKEEVDKGLREINVQKNNIENKIREKELEERLAPTDLEMQRINAEKARLEQRKERLEQMEVFYQAQRLKGNLGKASNTLGEAVTSYFNLIKKLTHPPLPQVNIQGVLLDIRG